MKPSMLTLEDVSVRIEKVRTLALADPEGAHSVRDQLLRDALELIKDRGSAGMMSGISASIHAAEVLKVFEIELRWDASA